jgi:hypothetical protein
VSVTLLVTGQARWVGIVQAGYARVQRETGLNDAEVAAREDALFRLLVTADAYPHLRAAVDAGVFLDQSDPFRFGLVRSRDGVAAYLESARGGRHDEPHPWTGLYDAGITEDRRVREAKKAVTAAEKTLRREQARAARRREARERLRRTGQG